MIRRTLLFLLPLSFVACSTPRTLYIDYREYPKLPELNSSKVLRKIAKATPGLDRKVFYGNYGGPGNNAGRPVDAMDECFRRHDIAYLEGHKRRQLVESDRTLVSNLESLDESSMNERALAYRNRAVKFFTSPLSRILGKPLDVLLGIKRKPVIIPGYGEEEEIGGK